MSIAEITERRPWLRIVDCEQGSEPWFRARMGMPTASQLKAVMANPRGDDAESRTRRKYMRQLAYEIVTETPMETYVNEAMRRGNEQEGEALRLYAMMADVEIERIGFGVRDFPNGRAFGASPDGLVGKEGGVEIKTQEPDLLIERLIEPSGFPLEFAQQCHGNMWVFGRTWWEVAIFSPRLPLFRRRLKRDDRYIQRIEIAVDAFLDELAEVVAKIRRYGGGP